MTSAYVQSLTVYPLKSAAGIDQQTVSVENAGMLGDRRFMLTKMDGTFITGRTHPDITAITCYFHEEQLVLSHPSCDSLILNEAKFSSQYYATAVWGTKFLGQGCGYEADQWISELLAEPLRILYFGDKSERLVVGHEEHEVGFADGFPLLLANQSSLAHLNERLLAPVSMANFRPNICIEGVPAWAEDEWAQIKIGEAIFELPKPCSRCIFTTVDPATAMLDVRKEPLNTLTQYRQEEGGSNVMFGENMVVVKAGVIKVGDKVEVLKTKAKPVYVDNWQSQTSRLAQHLTISNSTPAVLTGKQLMRCVHIVDETEDVKTFEFVVDPVQRVAYMPGQFITLQVMIDGQVYNRCYTLSSSPSRPDTISITVKRVDDGIVSNWLHDCVEKGSSLEFTSPAGIFHLSSDNKRKLLLLSAGSGITPMLSITQYITDLGLDIDVHFHHSAKTADDLIGFDHLRLLAKRHQNLTLSCNFSRDKNAQCDIDHQSGRVSEAILDQFCPDLLSRDVFVCGPDGFMKSAKQALMSLGLPQEQYDQESFVIGADAQGNSENSNQDTPSSYKVNFVLSGVEVDVNGDQTILEAAEEAGIYPDYSCLAGVCGSCNSNLISGDIHAPDARALDDEDKANGEFLPCCSYARSNLEVDL